MSYIGVKPKTAFDSVRKDRFTGQTGTTVTLSYAVSSVNDILVWVNGVKQDYTNYSVSSTTLTLGGTLVSSDIVEVAYLGRTYGTVSPAVNSVTNDMLVGSIANSKLANSSITLNGSAVSLGGSATVDNTPQFLARSSSQSISNTTHTAVINPTEIYDSDNLYNTTDGKFTVTSSTTGYYFLIGGVGFSVSSGTRMQASFYKNGSITDGFKTESYSSSSYPGLIVSGLFNLSSSGDYVQLYCYQNTGSSKNLSGEAEKNFFGGFKIIT